MKVDFSKRNGGGHSGYETIPPPSDVQSWELAHTSGWRESLLLSSDSSGGDEASGDANVARGDGSKGVQRHPPPLVNTAVFPSRRPEINFTTSPCAVQKNRAGRAE